MEYKELTLNIMLTKDDSISDILELITETINETNDKGYAVKQASVDGVEVFGDKGFSKEFFNKGKSED